MLPRVNIVRADHADYMLFASQDAISETIYRTGTWAYPLVTIARMFYAGQPEPLILDIGANLGAWCIPIAKEIAPANGTIFAYEPQRVVFYQLCGNIFLNRLDNVHPLMLALGETAGSATIPAINYAASRNVGGFSIDHVIRSSRTDITLADGKGHEVPLINLDSLDLHKPPCLIKIDVEGLELQVLNGGRNFLRSSGYPPLLLEAWTADWFQPQRARLLSALGDLGYTVFEVGDELITQHPDHPCAVEFQLDQGVIRMQRLR